MTLWTENDSALYSMGCDMRDRLTYSYSIVAFSECCEKPRQPKPDAVVDCAVQVSAMCEYKTLMLISTSTLALFSGLLLLLGLHKANLFLASWCSTVSETVTGRLS